MDNKHTVELIHGLTALILGLFLLGVSSGLGITKSIVDLWAAVLFIPEYPAVVARDIYLEWQSYSNDRDFLNAEVKRLREENAELRRDLSKLTNMSILESANKKNVRNARVNLRAPLEWWDELRIDRGSSDGITLGLPVFSEGYLVGRVSNVSLLSSWVELITSPSFMIPAVIEDTRELGIIAGDGNGNVLLKYIPAGRGLMNGMTVSTALIGEQLAPGLPIGIISGEFENSADGYATYRISPGAKLTRVYSVNY